jgi:hypothetical protein
MSKSRLSALCGLTALAVLTFAQDAGAQDDSVGRDRDGDLRVGSERAGFGEAGQWTFSTDAALAIERRTLSNSNGAGTTISILPATDYFVLDNLSVGGLVGVVYQKSGENRSTSFRIGPRVGYDIELSDLISIWPKLGFSYSHSKQKYSGSNADRSVTNDALQLNMYAPVMFHPAPHFFAGFGPFLDTDLNGDSRATVWGVRLTLGGWI